MASRLKEAVLSNDGALTIKVPVSQHADDSATLFPVFPCDQPTASPLWYRGTTSKGAHGVVATPVGRDLRVFVLTTTGEVFRRWHVAEQTDTLHVTYEANTLGVPAGWEGGQCTAAPDAPLVIAGLDAVNQVPLPNPVDERRRLRLALATTPAFVSRHSGNDPARAAQHAAAAAAEAGLIFERDSGLVFCVVPFEGAHPVPEGEPACPDGEAAIAEATARLEGNDANLYDLGHVLRCGTTGSARAGVCSSLRAAGQTGFSTSGFSDGDMTLFMHELGHQLGAGHTFSGRLRPNNWDPANAVEPGSGSTLMSYAPLWNGSDQVSEWRDFYFHSASVARILTFTRHVPCVPPCLDQSASCGERVTALPAAPQLPCGGRVFHVPERHPFLLPSCAIASAANVSERWEEIDLATKQGAVPPVIRSQLPLEAPRSIPSLGVALDPQMARVGDRFPSADSRLRFRLTAREPSGATAFGDVEVNVAGPVDFRVTAPAGGKKLTNEPGHDLRVEWTFSAIRGAPFNVQKVAIDLSTDNGTSWRTLGVFENSGAADVRMDGLDEGKHDVRLRIRGVDHIVYTVSDPFALDVRGT